MLDFERKIRARVPNLEDLAQKRIDTERAQQVAAERARQLQQLQEQRCIGQALKIGKEAVELLMRFGPPPIELRFRMVDSDPQEQTTYPEGWNVYRKPTGPEASYDQFCLSTEGQALVYDCSGRSTAVDGKRSLEVVRSENFEKGVLSLIEYGRPFEC